MAAGAVQEDGGKTWRITLRDGLRFHDGTPVLARDCAASIKRWGARDPFGQALIAAADEITGVDDKTIQFRLKAPFPLLPDALAKTPPSMCAIMPERLALTDPYKQVTEMVGSGPFRFKADERVSGSLLVYEKFAGYVPRPDGKPDWTAGPKSCISTASNGTSSRRQHRRCPPSGGARWIGGGCRMRTCCRRWARTRASWCARTTRRA